MITFYTGDPGAGKSTAGLALSHGPRTARRDGGHEVPVLSIGHEIRHYAPQQLTGGHFGPEDFVRGMVRGLWTTRGPVVVDGFPRRPLQVQDVLYVHDRIVSSGMPGVSIVWMSIDPDEAVRRYLAVGATACVECGNIAQHGRSCACGGVDTDPEVGKWYTRRRRLQSHDLQSTRAELRFHPRLQVQEVQA